MVFGKHINRYYIKYGFLLGIGLIALLTVDYLQLIIPNLYQMVINGMNTGKVQIEDMIFYFDMDFLLQRICFPLIIIVCIIVAIVVYFGVLFKTKGLTHDDLLDFPMGLRIERLAKKIKLM